MNWSSKYTSVHEIIAKVYRDMGMQDQLNIADAIEWAGEAIELIGAPFHLSEKIEHLSIVDYKANLPCDLHYVQSMKACPGELSTDVCFKPSTGHYIPMRYSTDLYHHWYCDSEYFCEDNCSDLTYKLNDDYVHTSFSEGYVLISYLGIPIDEEGYPKIPDDIKFKEAVAGHIKWRLGFIRWMTGKIPGGVYQKLEQDRDWYIGAAQTRAQMPSMDMMESIKNNWLRLIPKINQHSDGFKSSGQREQRINHTTKDSGTNSSGKGDTFFYTS